MRFSADGREVLSGGQDGTVRIHDAATGEERLAFYGLTAAVVDVEWGAGGALVGAVTTEGVAKVWDRKRSADAALMAKRPARAAAAAADAEGWDDLLARLTPAEVEKTGRGWLLTNGELVSSDTKYATVALPEDLSGGSYRVRVTLRQRAAKDVFHVVLPVGGRMTRFELDGFGGKYTGLNTAGGKTGKDLPGVVTGKQVKDSEAHELEITVRVAGDAATVTATLDGR
ncbi:MAG TPA: hypothetical protein VEA69_05760, partial [Tepidisphaeraceae bacterium]|nr:hypothetical protein [Tepidisphaeraceae bacterium]